MATDTWLRQVTGSWRAPVLDAPPPPPPEPEPEPEPKSSRLSALTGIWHKHSDLLHNAASLAATTGVTSLLGFAFWTFAARYFSQEAVGYGSAAISAMTLLGTIGMFGLGTVLIGELPQRRSRGGLVASALIVSSVGSLILGVGFVIAAPHFSNRFVEISGTPGRMLLFAVGVALTGATLVFDEATIGLLRGGLQLSRNLTFSIVKMAVLPAAALVLHDMFGVGIILAWVVGTAASIIPTAIQLRIGGTNIMPRPDWGVMRGLGRTTMAHNWLNLAIGVPQTLIPVLVTVVVSPAANAAFYVAWMLSSFLFVVPTHLSTVLYAVASADPKVIAKKLRFVLRLSVYIGVPAMVILWFAAGPALSIFGKQYAAEATVPFRLLILGYLPALPKTQYIAVCRAAWAGDAGGRHPHHRVDLRNGGRDHRRPDGRPGGADGGPAGDLDRRGTDHGTGRVPHRPRARAAPPGCRGRGSPGRHRPHPGGRGPAGFRTSPSDALVPHGRAGHRAAAGGAARGRAAAALRADRGPQPGGAEGPGAGTPAGGRAGRAHVAGHDRPVPDPQPGPSGRADVQLRAGRAA